MSIEVTTKISSTRISDMFVGAIEGNHMTRAWCECIEVSDYLADKFQNEDHTPWYSNPAFFDEPYTITVTHDGEESGEGDHDVTTVITPLRVSEGLQIMASKFPRHFADLVNERDDNITQDVFLQCIVLKDAIFG